MARLVWDTRYATNIEEIDEQHRHLLALINNVQDGLREGVGRDRMGRIIREMVAYVHTHLSDEEEMMRRSAYPGLSQHQAIHAWFIQRVNDFDVKYRHEQLGLGPEVMGFLYDWLVKHIMGTDMQYVPHVKAYLRNSTKRYPTNQS